MTPSLRSAWLHRAVGSALLVLAACTAPRSPDLAPVPSTTLAQATPPATSASEPVAPQLSVLGGSRADWVKALGQPRTEFGRDMFGTQLEVYWVRDAADQERAGRVVVLLAEPSDLERAHEQAHRYHPRDGQLVRSYAASDGREVEVFQSAELASAFAGATVQGPPGTGRRALFGTDAPGTYIESAGRSGSTTTEVTLALGNTP